MKRILVSEAELYEAINRAVDALLALTARPDAGEALVRPARCPCGRHLSVDGSSEDPLFLTPDEAGARLGMSRYKAIKLFGQGKLLGFSNDKIVRIYADSVDHFLRKRTNYDPAVDPHFDRPPPTALDAGTVRQRLHAEMDRIAAVPGEANGGEEPTV